MNIDIKLLFAHIAQKYDFLNDLMTLGLHRAWKKRACELLSPAASSGKLLDIACGTGDISFQLEAMYKEYTVYGVDFSEEMLSVARCRKNKQGSEVNFLEADALDLPFADNYFAGAIISYGLRNISQRDKCLKEIYRVCSQGAKLVILDLSHPIFPFDKLSTLYRYRLVPCLGSIFTSCPQAYEYLPNSIKNYPDQEELMQMLKRNAWKDVEYENILGGISAIHWGAKSFLDS